MLWSQADRLLSLGRSLPQPPEGVGKRDTAGPEVPLASQLCEGCRSDQQGGGSGPGSCTRWGMHQCQPAHFGKRWMMSFHDGTVCTLVSGVFARWAPHGTLLLAKQHSRLSHVHHTAYDTDIPKCMAVYSFETHCNRARRRQTQHAIGRNFTSLRQRLSDPLGQQENHRNSRQAAAPAAPRRPAPLVTSALMPLTAAGWRPAAACAAAVQATVNAVAAAAGQREAAAAAGGFAHHAAAAAAAAAAVEAAAAAAALAAAAEPALACPTHALRAGPAPDAAAAAAAQCAAGGPAPAQQRPLVQCAQAQCCRLDM